MGSVHLGGTGEVTRWIRDLAAWDAIAGLTWRPPAPARYDAQGRNVSRRGWPDGPTVDAAHRHLQGWADRCSIPAIFYSLEVGPIGGRVHGHCLLGLDGQPLEGLRRAWYSRFGRSTITRILPGERATVATAYCTKYVSAELFRTDGRLLWGVRVNGQAWH